LPAADFDSDGDVDGADLAKWRTGFGSIGAPTRAQGNTDGDGDVDGADFLFWQRSLVAGGAVQALSSAAQAAAASETEWTAEVVASLAGWQPMTVAGPEKRRESPLLQRIHDLTWDEWSGGAWFKPGAHPIVVDDEGDRETDFGEAKSNSIEEAVWSTSRTIGVAAIMQLDAALKASGGR